uniref:Uncharacterized protein n=1 Tax=Panagrolaimus sp. PS1159 TaxID=55785 RepID=A0AC35FZZ2_9BILA
MSNFFTKIFKPSRKSNRENFQPLEDYGSGGQRTSSIKQNSRNEFDTGILKSSMRRRATAYDDDFLRAPGAAYHTSTQPQRHRGPKSLPPSRTYEESPNASPSSSTDGGGGGGYELERSFHSEFIPSSHQPSTSRRKSKRQHRPPTDFYHPSSRDARHRYLKEESDSEFYAEEEMNHAVKQIKRYKTSLKTAIEDVRKLRNENDRLLQQIHLIKLDKDHKIQQLESEIAQLSQEKRSLEIENTNIKSMAYSYGGGLPQRYPHYPPSYLQQPPPSHYPYMTPPSGLRSAAQFNNTNTGSLMASGGGDRNNNNNNFRGGLPPSHHQRGENIFGNNNSNINEGSGEQLAIFSANTTASQALLPGMPAIPGGDEISDEVKIFRKVDESSPSRPPTNSNQSLILSTGIGGGSNSTGSSPPTNTNNSKTNEQTPVASIKKECSPKASNPNIDAFNEIISKQLNALTPKSSKIKKTKSLSTMDEIVVNFETATNLN